MTIQNRLFQSRIRGFKKNEEEQQNDDAVTKSSSVEETEVVDETADEDLDESFEALEEGGKYETGQIADVIKAVGDDDMSLQITGGGKKTKWLSLDKNMARAISDVFAKYLK